MHASYSNGSYTVIIGENSFSKGWLVIHDTLKIEDEQEIDVVNDELADIYEYIYRDSSNCKTHFHNDNETKMYYTTSDISPELILAKWKDKFVFLKSGEIYVDRYNLIGFKLLQGCFTFYINPYLPAYVHTTPIWDNNQSKYMGVKTVLPIAVGEYKLYSGILNSNKITITF